MKPEERIALLLRENIPLTRAMGVEVQSYDGVELVLTAPHEPNHNHLNTAFGGSLHSLATLSGYGWLWLELGVADAASPNVHVVVRESHMEYLLPVRGELRAVCRRPAQDALTKFWKDFHARGKARLTLEAVIEEAGTVAAHFRGEFVAVS
jgi:thioesterase domain-containing protein